MINNLIKEDKCKMQTRRYSHSSGAVSMITVIILSILLILITTAFVGSAISQQRNATNADLSTRAYYAAQAGFEDAVRKLREDTSVNVDNVTIVSTCSDKTYTINGGVVSRAGNIDSAYTCQLVKPEAIELTYDNIPTNGTVLFPIIPRTNQPPGKYKVKVRWVSSGSNLPSDNKALLSSESWNTAGYPAMLRAGLTWYWNNGNGNVKAQSYYLAPSNLGSSETNNTLPVAMSGDYAPTSSTDPILNTQCVDMGDSKYSCTNTITVDTGDKELGVHYSGVLNSDKMYELYVATRSIYKGTDSVNISLYNDADKNIPLVGQITVDVTGRAGNVYRRIAQKIPYGNFTVRPVNFATNMPIPDFSIIGGDGICKQTSMGLSEEKYIPANGLTKDCKPN